MATIRERQGRKGKPVYFVEIRIKGHPPIRETFERKTDAKKWAQDRESDIRNRRNFGTQESLKYTFAQAVDRYLETELSKRNSDHRKFKLHLGWWKQHMGHYLLADITAPLITQYRDILINEWIQKGPKSPKVQRKPATIKLYLASLSILMSTAEKEWGWITQNPTKGVRKPTVKNARTRFLDAEEQAVLLKAAKDDANPHVWDLIMLALSTGARWSELVGLTWREVDLKAKKPIIRLEHTKNGEKRAVPITGPALEILKRRRAKQVIHSPYVFTRLDCKAPMDFRTAWERVLTRSGLKNFTFHDLRHTTASNLAMNGASLLEIAQVLGHKTLAMVKRYAHLTEQHTHTIMEKMNERQFGTGN